VLYGEKTALRPVDAKDLDLINRWLHDPAMTGEDVPLALYPLAAVPHAPESAKLYIIQVKGRAIGLFAVRRPFGHWTPLELCGAVADPRERGHGYGTDALVTLIHFLFSSQPVARLYIRTAVSNKRARAWLETLGFKLDGIERDLFFFSGAFQDVALYGMTRTDYDQGLGKSPAAGHVTDLPPPRPPRGRAAEIPCDDRDNREDDVSGAPPPRARPTRLSPERIAEETPPPPTRSRAPAHAPAPRSREPEPPRHRPPESRHHAPEPRNLEPEPRHRDSAPRHPASEPRHHAPESRHHDDHPRADARPRRRFRI
jgi:RimJ/RimL family protein N-acetyltransferase